jgi:selenium metabolism protein YedF
MISKSNQELINENAEQYCPITTSDSTTRDMIVINKNTMGHGPNDLSLKLVQGFFSTIAEVSPKPYAIAFYNSGILHCLEDSPVLSELQQIEKAGTKILVCGTCTDHYQVSEKVKVGIISNMYDILTAMQQSTKVFTP